MDSDFEFTDSDDDFHAHNSFVDESISIEGDVDEDELISIHDRISARDERPPIQTRSESHRNGMLR